MPSTLPYAENGPSALIVEDETALGEELRELLQTLWPALRVIGHAEDGATALDMIAGISPTSSFSTSRFPTRTGWKWRA